MTKSAFGILLLTLIIFYGCQSPQRQETEVRPNVVYILADDLGYGDLSCYGQTKFTTPNIDRLATHGMRFTQHYAGSTVCAPSRASLLTGMHTGHTAVRGNKEYQPEGQEPLPADALTLAEVASQAGYATGAFGKWGLGFVTTPGDPVKQGFDRFFGYNCQRQAHRQYADHLWSNDDRYPLQGNDLSHQVTYGPDVIQKKALEFISENRDHPFFLYLPYTLPHAELVAPDDSLLSRYQGKFLPEKPYVGGEGADYGSPDFKVAAYASQPQPHAAFAAMVARLDRYVGQVVDTLQALGLLDQTLIIFTSDNGPHLEGGADPDYFNSNGPFRGYKRDLYEGGIRVPMIASWHGHIAEGTTNDHISAFWDVFPTCCDIFGVAPPDDIDGISFLPTLMGKPDQKEHEYLYWEFHELGGRQAVRMNQWKAVRLNVKEHPDAPTELYDLSADPGETNNVAAMHPDIVHRMDSVMSVAHVPNPVFKFFAGE